MNRHREHNPGRTDEILMYIWRWKVVPTWMVHLRFFAGHHATAAYDLLYRSRQLGLVAIQRTRNENIKGWTLTLRGFKRIEPQVNGLRNIRYLSQSPVHDLLVAVIHGGLPLVTNLAGSMSILTEQQIQSQDVAGLVPWFPRRLSRAADGIWRIGPGPAQRVIALELELSRKSVSKYVEILNEYRIAEGLHGVVWICASRCIQSHIKAATAMLPESVAQRIWATTQREVVRNHYGASLWNSLGQSCRIDSLLGIETQVKTQVPESVDPFDMRLYFSYQKKKSETQEISSPVLQASTPNCINPVIFNQENTHA